MKAAIISLLFAMCLASVGRAEDQTTVGIIVPLTGPYANFGEAARTGFEMAMAESGSKKLKPVFEDSQYDASKAVAAYNKLVSVDGATVLVVLGTPPSSAVIPIAEKRGIPVFAWTPSKRITSGHPSVMRLMSSGSEQGAVMSERAKAEGYQSVGYLIAQNEFAQTVRDGFLEHFGKSSVILNEEVPPAETDFRAQILRGRSAGIKAFGVCLNTGQIPAFLKQAKELNVNVPFFGCQAASSPEVMKTLVATGAKAWFVEGRMTQSFLSAFQERYPDSSGAWLGAAFHDVGLMLAANPASPGLIERLREKCVEHSAFPKSCVAYRNDEAFLDVPLGVTSMEDGKFIR